jgi:hypothetical protein
MSCNRYQKLYFWLRQRYMFRAIFVLLLLFSSPHLIKAQTVPEPTSIPELTSISPQGGQRGTNVEIAFKGKNISKATALLFSGEGISGEIGEKTGEAAVFFSGEGISGHIPNDSRLVAQVTIAPNAALGMREVRLVTPKGVSNAQPFVVGDLPEVGEIEPNSEPSAANWINLPTTVSGVIDSVDDQDFFRFNAKAEQRLICDVTASRMGSLLDSFLALFGPDGVEIASNDIANGLDSLIDYTIPMEGEYTLRIRDLRYKGGEEFVYRLSVGELPYLDSIFPLGGRRGTENTIAVSGRNLADVALMQVSIAPNAPNSLKEGVDDDWSMQVSIAPDAPLGVQDVRVMTPSGLSTNSYPFMVGDLPEFVETEPNNTREQVTSDDAGANTVTSPIIINGQIELEEDVDYFIFTAEKGQRLIFEVTAQRLGSKLDALLTLFDKVETEDKAEDSDATTDSSTATQPEDGTLAVNDDTMGSEARIDYTFEEAGDYAIAIRDLNNQGGPDFAYRLSITPLRSDFRFTVTPDNPRICRGDSTSLTLEVSRIDEFDGPLRFALHNLPKDFAVSPTILEPGQMQALITLTAPPDAPLGFLPISLIGIGAIHNRRVERKAEPDPIFLTVMEAPQFVLEVAEVGLSIVQSREAPLHVIVNRKQGFIGPIALSVVGLPENSEASESILAEGETEATVTIKAGSFFRRELFSVLPPAGTQHIAVTGSATINNEPVIHTTPALPLTIIEAPFVVTVTPLRQSIILPAVSPVTESPEGSHTPSEHLTASVSEAGDTITETSTKEVTEQAILTVTVSRQGGFTDKIDVVPIDLPAGFTVSEVSIPEHETEVKMTLTASDALEADTYDIKFTGSGMINGQQFEQESPTVAVKIVR